MNILKSKCLKHFNKVYQSYSNDEDFISIDSFQEYVKTGKERFEHKVVLFGEEKIEYFDILTIFSIVKGYYLCDFILKYKHDKHDKHDKQYNYLLNAYYFSVLYNILNLKNEKFATAVLSTDLSLMFMFSLTYFSEETDLIGQQFINFLEYNQQSEKENNCFKGKMETMFGYSNIIWLSFYVANYYEKKDLSNQINEFIKEIQPEPCYKEAVEKLFSIEENEVNNWVNQLVDFHIKNSKSDLTLPFNHEEWQYYPIEIIALLEIRLIEGFKIDFISNEYLKEFLPYLGNKKNIELDDFTEKLRNRVL